MGIEIPDPLEDLLSDPEEEIRSFVNFDLPDYYHRAQVERKSRPRKDDCLKE